MKLNLRNSVAPLLAAVALALAGCQPDGAKNSAALVTSITVAGAPVAVVPAPVPRSVWDGADFSLFDLETGQVGEAVISQSSALANAQIEVKSSAGATVKYAAADIDVPQEFQAKSEVTLASNGYLCIQVTSEDGASVNYYVLEIRVANSLATLTSVTVASVEAALGAPSADWAQAAAGSATLNATQANGAQAAVVKTNSSQTVKYAKASGGEAPSFGDAATFTFADGDFLYIEVTAENGIDKNVYKIEVQVGRDTTLSSLSIGGVSVSDYGVPAAALADVVSGRLVFAAVDNTPRAIAVTPADSGAAVTWTAAETDPAETAFGTTTPLAFTEGGYLYVKVTAANGTTTAYYKIQIGVPAIVEKIEAGGSSVPVYRFTPPEGSTWGDYKTLAFTVMVADQTSYSESAARAHIVGNYPASNFIETTGAFSKLSSWNDARLVNISNGGTLSAIIGDPGLYAWKELSYPIVLDDIAADGKSDSSYTTDSYYPAADAAGPFYFGLGLTVNPNSAADRTVTYYIKDVALVKADGTKLLADDLATEFGSVTLGNLKCIFSNAAGAVVNRTLEAEPLPPSAAE